MWQKRVVFIFSLIIVTQVNQVLCDGITPATATTKSSNQTESSGVPVDLRKNEPESSNHTTPAGVTSPSESNGTSTASSNSTSTTSTASSTLFLNGSTTVGVTHPAQELKTSDTSTVSPTASTTARSLNNVTTSPTTPNPNPKQTDHPTINNSNGTSITNSTSPLKDDASLLHDASSTTHMPGNGTTSLNHETSTQIPKIKTNSNRTNIQIQENRSNANGTSTANSIASTGKGPSNVSFDRSSTPMLPSSGESASFNQSAVTPSPDLAHPAKNSTGKSGHLTPVLHNSSIKSEKNSSTSAIPSNATARNATTSIHVTSNSSTTVQPNNGSSIAPSKKTDNSTLLNANSTTPLRHDPKNKTNPNETAIQISKNGTSLNVTAAVATAVSSTMNESSTSSSNGTSTTTAITSSFNSSTSGAGPTSSTERPDLTHPQKNSTRTPKNLTNLSHNSTAESQKNSSAPSIPPHATSTASRSVIASHGNATSESLTTTPDPPPSLVMARDTMKGHTIKKDVTDGSSGKVNSTSDGRNGTASTNSTINHNSTATDAKTTVSVNSTGITHSNSTSHANSTASTSLNNSTLPANSTATTPIYNSTLHANSTATTLIHDSTATTAAPNSTSVTSVHNSTLPSNSSATTSISNSTLPMNFTTATPVHNSTLQNNSTAATPAQNSTLPANSTATTSAHNSTIHTNSTATTPGYNSTLGSPPTTQSTKQPTTAPPALNATTTKTIFNFMIKDNDSDIPCLLSNMSIDLKVFYKKSDKTVSESILHVPTTAESNGTCTENDAQLMLVWKEKNSKAKRAVASRNTTLHDDEHNILVFNFIKDGTTAKLDKVQASIYLDKHHFPNSTENILKGESASGLELFKGKIDANTYVCNIPTDVKAGDIAITIKNISLIAFKSKNEPVSKKVEGCQTRAGINIGVVVGGFIGMALIICFVMYLIARRKKKRLPLITNPVNTSNNSVIPVTEL
uniref:Lysosome-associated membrane glycoprotein 2-like luminal domain-containing protein n=1 Tax=Fopius arisanus TaxID=64838 RepID=A0A0C9PZB0_9HYME